MPHVVAAKTATRDRDAACYQRHRPAQTLFYQIVEEYYPAFTAHLTEQGGELPAYVRREFEDYLKCGRLEWLPAGTLRELPRRTSGCVQLETPWLLSELRRTAYGQKRCAAGR